MIFPVLPRAKTLDGTAYYAAGPNAADAPNAPGAPVVLLHGVGLCAESWFRQIRRLQKSRPVFAVDLPGHGKSPMLKTAAPALSDFAAAAAAAVQQTVHAPAVFVGHSMGALIALALAARLPHLCAGVVAISAVYRRLPNARAAVLQRAANLQTGGANHNETLLRWFGNNPRGRNRRAVALCRQWLAAANMGGYAALYGAFAQDNEPAEGKLAEVRAPCLFMTGENDPNSTPAMSRALANAAPCGEFIQIGGAAHLLQLTHAAEINRALLAFAEKCENIAQAESKPKRARGAKHANAATFLNPKNSENSGNSAKTGNGQVSAMLENSARFAGAKNAAAKTGAERL